MDIRLARTSKGWYFQAQRIPEKVEAMKRWSEALLKAFKDAGASIATRRVV
jgi:hypothetical protein